jgi:hypothetical protein
VLAPGVEDDDAKLTGVERLADAPRHWVVEREVAAGPGGDAHEGNIVRGNCRGHNGHAAGQSGCRLVQTSMTSSTV